MGVLLGPVQIALALLLAYAVYVAGLVVYRLLLHPLAGFPGPRSAAVSFWPEFYYDVVHKGKFTFAIDRWHEQYGPIIRVTPDEIHIKDSQFYDTIYTKAGRVDKYERTAGRFESNMSMFTTSSADLHAVRRGSLNPLFSRGRIVQLESLIRDKIDILVRQILTHQKSGRPFNADKAYMAYAGDVIMRYSFGMDYDHLNTKDFELTLHDVFFALMLTSGLSLQYPIVPRILNLLPESWVEKIQPLFAILFQFKRDLMKQIAAVKNDRELDSEKSVTTVIQTLLADLNLPATQKEDKRLSDESLILTAAAVSTTGRTLTAGTFHILNNPAVEDRLRKELEDAIPDPNAPLRWTELEKLPYLTACIRESLRLAYPVSSRSQRLLPRPIMYGSWTIPARVPVSMTINDIHNDEEIFPNHEIFKPERWINPPKTPDGSSLDRYLVAFQKGTRSCLGVNLAYCEMYHIMATLFRNFRFELFESDESDVAFAHDFFASAPRLDSKGLRLRCLPDL